MVAGNQCTAGTLVEAERRDTGLGRDSLEQIDRCDSECTAAAAAGTTTSADAVAAAVTVAAAAAAAAMLTAVGSDNL